MRADDRGDDAVQAYVDAIDAEHRPLFDRLHGLIVAACPEATIRISYDIPTYEVAGRRLYLGIWQHGVSLYGWGADRDGGFLERHPDLRHGKGTIRIRPADAVDLTDDDLTSLIHAALAP